MFLSIRKILNWHKPGIGDYGMQPAWCEARNVNVVESVTTWSSKYCLIDRIYDLSPEALAVAEILWLPYISLKCSLDAEDTKINHEVDDFIVRAYRGRIILSSRFWIFRSRQPSDKYMILFTALIALTIQSNSQALKPRCSRRPLQSQSNFVSKSQRSPQIR
jgi:hypothetical protein